MVIAVIAANGRSGQAFVRYALERGHEVRAGVHRNGLNFEHKNLKVFTCDAGVRADVERLIKGCDAVVSLIGHVRGSKPDVQAEAMTIIASAMHAQGIARLVSLTGTGVRFRGDHIPLTDRFSNIAIGAIGPARIKDGRRHADVLKHSGLDWTLIRVLKLNNGAPKNFTLKRGGPPKLLTPRAEVARAILRVLEENSFIKSAPVIGK